MDQLEKEIADVRKEIAGLIDCFVKRIFPLFGEQFEYYKLLTVKLYRLQLKKEIENIKNNYAVSNYRVAEGCKI